MMKTENLPLVRISIRGKSGDISLIEEEPGLSLEEWKHVRDAAFARLRKAVTIIPRQLIDLVEQLNHRTLVQIFFNKTLDGSGLSFGIKPLGKKTKGSVGEPETCGEAAYSGTGAHIKSGPTECDFGNCNGPIG